MFQKFECWKCHGTDGRGDGPSAAALTDSKDQPIHPFDFTTERASSAERPTRICTAFS